MIGILARDVFLEATSPPRTCRSVIAARTDTATIPVNIRACGAVIAALLKTQLWLSAATGNPVEEWSTICSLIALPVEGLQQVIPAIVAVRVPTDQSVRGLFVTRFVEGRPVIDHAITADWKHTIGAAGIGCRIAVVCAIVALLAALRVCDPISARIVISRHALAVHAPIPRRTDIAIVAGCSIGYREMLAPDLAGAAVMAGIVGAVIPVVAAPGAVAGVCGV